MIAYSEGFLKSCDDENKEIYEEGFVKGKNYSVGFGKLLGKIEYNSDI
jgi:hypothetical protein